jgi:hypothetical protein
MMEDLAERVASDPELADKVIVAPLAFANAVLGARKGEYTKGKAQLLHRYEGEIKEKKKEKIIFPANVGNCHWVAGVIDFPNNSIGFGELTFHPEGQDTNIGQGIQCQTASSPQ